MRFVTILALLFSFLSQGQELRLKELYTLKNKNFTTYTPDVLDNIYMVAGDEIIKYSPEGKEMARYSSPDLMSIDFLDAFISLDLLVYYKTYYRTIIVDNQLNAKTPVIPLDDHGLMDVQLVRSADENKVWLYDQSTDQMALFNLYTRKKEIESLRISQITGLQIRPNYLVYTINRIYLNLPGQGIMMFDLFGNYQRTLPVVVADKFQVINYLVYYVQDNFLIVYNPDLRSEVRYALEELLLGGEILLGKNRLYCLRKGELKAYEFHLLGVD
jgi:hypothetical protein